MSKPVECVDCILEGVIRHRPVTGKRVKRCATHVRVKKKLEKARSGTRRRLNVYGMTEEDTRELMGYQNGVCAICGPVTGNRGVKRALCVDHDHKCCDGPTSCGECVRGFLCGVCNTFLGRIGDDPEVARRMIEYLSDPPWQQIRRSKDAG